eukprot:Sdes_comp22914_c0_seq1m21286
MMKYFPLIFRHEIFNLVTVKNISSFSKHSFRPLAPTKIHRRFLPPTQTCSFHSSVKKPYCKKDDDSSEKSPGEKSEASSEEGEESGGGKGEKLGENYEKTEKRAHLVKNPETATTATTKPHYKSRHARKRMAGTGFEEVVQSAEEGAGEKSASVLKVNHGGGNSSNHSIIEFGVPRIFPEVLAIPVSRHPIFPGFVKHIEVRSKELAAALQKRVNHGAPYVGTFLYRDDSKSEDVITNLADIYPV